MFIGIDGTGPGDDTEYMDRMRGGGGTGQSFVWRIYNQSQERRKAYYRGPTALGSEVPSITRAVVSKVIEWTKEGDNRLFLAGWSRGAAICVLVAQDLLRRQDFQGNVDCMALFDAVDRAAGSPDLIPHNVSKAFHAMRDSRVRSWEGTSSSGASAWLSFGNTATRHAIPNNLETHTFFATHAGIGGVPWTGDQPTELAFERTTSFGFIPDVRVVHRPTITEAQDVAGAESVRQWMWTRIRQHGMVP